MMMNSVLLFVCLLVLTQLASARLVSVVGISRHGTRAANPSLANICPGDLPNIKNYEKMGLSPGGLTGIGMHELKELGTFTRQRYIEHFDLVPKRFSNQVLVQAVESERTLQSAWAFGQGFYPDGNVPTGYSKMETGPLAVYSMPARIDNLLEARKANCKTKLQHDVEDWDTTEGKKLVAEKKYAAVIAKIGGLCGNPELQNTPFPALGDDIKDISDALTFDFYSGFKMLDGLSVDDLNDLRELAVKILFGRMYSTPEQHTYMSGSLPDWMQDNFNKALAGTENRKLSIFHGHREMLYAMGFYFGIDYDVPAVGVPKGAIPSATTVFFELHEQEAEDYKEALKQGQHDIVHGKVKEGERELKENLSGDKATETVKFVRTVLFRPKDSCTQEELDGEHGEHCAPLYTKLKHCSHVDCPLDEFLAIIAERQSASPLGDWDGICKDAEAATQNKLEQGFSSYEKLDFDADDRFIYDPHRIHSSPASTMFHLALVAAVAALAFVVYLAYNNNKKNNTKYTSII